MGTHRGRRGGAGDAAGRPPLPATATARAGAVLAHDTLLAGLAAAIALWLRLDHGSFGDAAHRGGLALAVPAFAATALAAFLLLGVHRRPWRHFSLADLWSIQLAAAAAGGGFAVVALALAPPGAIPRSVPAIAWLVLAVLLVGSRLSYRRLRGRDGGGRSRPSEEPGEAAARGRGGRLVLWRLAPEDLLGRPQVALDRAAIGRLIGGRRVLVTGAGGTIGGELCRQIAALRPAALVLFDHSEFNLYRIELELREDAPPGGVAVQALLGDVRDAERVARTFAEHRPELVFHAAALKHVPLVEANPVEGVLTNALGTRVVAEAARAHRALALVQISTDKAVNPTGVMGATKRVAEAYCQALDLAAGAAWGDSEGDGTDGTRFMTVRFGNVIGSSGSVVPLFQRQLARGGPLTVTHPEVRRYFMTTGEAVGLVLQASAQGLARPQERGRVFVLDMGEPVRIVDVARRMIRLAGLEPDVDVRIEFVGLRPGEKLAEELFHAEEVPVPAGVGGVLAVASRPVPLPELAAALDRLAAAARRDDAPAVRRLLAGLVEGLAGGGGAATRVAAEGPGHAAPAPPEEVTPMPIDLAAVRQARRPTAGALGAATG